MLSASVEITFDNADNRFMVRAQVLCTASITGVRRSRITHTHTRTHTSLAGRVCKLYGAASHRTAEGTAGAQTPGTPQRSHHLHECGSTGRFEGTPHRCCSAGRQG